MQHWYYINVPLCRFIRSLVGVKKGTYFNIVPPGVPAKSSNKRLGRRNGGTKHKYSCTILIKTHSTLYIKTLTVSVSLLLTHHALAAIATGASIWAWRWWHGIQVFLSRCLEIKAIFLLWVLLLKFLLSHPLKVWHVHVDWLRHNWKWKILFPTNSWDGSQVGWR